MPFCASCGLPVEGQFCAHCGKPVGTAQSAAPSAAPGVRFAGAAGITTAPAAGMAENVASVVCYVLGFITGIIFLVLAPYNHNKVIRFHAFQSIFLSVAWIAIVIAEQIVNGAVTLISWRLLALLAMVWTVVGLGFLVLWVVLMVKAYQGQRWKLPVIGDLAEKHA